MEAKTRGGGDAEVCCFPMPPPRLKPLSAEAFKPSNFGDGLVTPQAPVPDPEDVGTPTEKVSNQLSHYDTVGAR
jgi:hypothetical protein